MDIITLKSFIPEIFFSLSILFQLVYNVRVVNNLKHNFPIISKEVFFQTIFILLCMVYMFNDLQLEGFLSNFLLINDQGTKFSKIIISLISIFALVIVQESFKFQKINFFEFYSILSLSILSLLLMVSASDLILFYLTMEMQALCFYILASLNRNSTFSVEAGLKYFVSGSFISGFYLLGCSLIYGCLGTLNLNNLNLLTIFHLNTYSSELNFLVLIGIIFITSTLLFKLACAPFHFWSPDVYDGAPISSTLVFSVLPKFAIFFFFIKWINSINTLFDSISDILLVFGLLSAFLGTFFALNQKRLKRLIIYSSIAQTGFLVSGLGLLNLEGYSYTFLFLILYIITSILIWGHFVLFHLYSVKTNHYYNKEITSLYISTINNLSKHNIIWSFSLVIIFFSIAGIPPFSGFLAKMLIIYNLVNLNYIVFACILVLISAFSVYYYIRILKVAYFEPKKENLSEDFKTIYSFSYLESLILIIPILLSVLILLFYTPDFFLLLSQYVSVGSFLY